MGEYSDSGLYQFPRLTPDALGGKDAAYRMRLIGWIEEAAIEGDALNQADPNYERIEEGMAYVMGDQARGGGAPRNLPPHLKPRVFNVSRRALQAHVSALTDVKPTFGWKSLNPKYQMVAHQLNLLAIAWWLNQMADVSFGDVIKIAWTCGTADMGVEWNPSLPGGGDHQVVPKDPRDTLPWRPPRFGDEQSWQGVLFRELWSVNVLREKYGPAVAPLIQATEDSVLATIKGLFFRKSASFQTPMDPLSALSAGAKLAGPPRRGDCLLYRVYLDDRTRNLTGRPITMGMDRYSSGAGFQYVVEPGKLLYPYKRLIILTNDLVLYDGPNPYMHGKYPFARLHLWKLPWCFLGQSALADLMPVQDSINRAALHMDMGIEQWMDRQTVLDKTAVSAATAKGYDSRKPGFTFQLKSNVIDPTKVVTKLEGPNPQVMAQNFQWFQQLNQTFESLAGTGNLERLLQARQLPSGDTVQKYFEAMTPELRMEGRMFETFLRKASQQICFNTFQFMTSARRVAILGDAAQLLEDFDLDPDTLVPAMQPTLPDPAGTVDPYTGQPATIANPDYDPQFDANLPRAVRAETMAKLMVFVVAPNSVLAFNAQEEKMLDFQMARMGYLDIWSLAERLERPNFGAPPAIPLPPLQPLPAGLTADPQLLMTWLLSQPPGKYILDPATGQILEIRAPVTVTERLQAQMLLGIGMTANPAGRKASGQAPPEVEDKGDRQTVTESKK